MFVAYAFEHLNAQLETPDATGAALCALQEAAIGQDIRMKSLIVLLMHYGNHNKCETCS